MKKLRYLLLMVLALTLLAAAGCSDNKNNVGGDDNKTTITADKGSAPQALPDKEKEKAAKGTKAPRKTKETKATTKKEPAIATNKPKEGDVCPLCGRGTIIRGRTAFGCSRWNDAQEPCTWRLPFDN